MLLKEHGRSWTSLVLWREIKKITLNLFRKLMNRV
jgi:hypothetical protein